MSRPLPSRTTFVAVLVCAVLAFACTARADDPTGALSGVTDLTAANFDTLVGKTTAALVEFYAPWCGHCKNMVPELQRLGEAFVAKTDAKEKLIIGKVDATVHSDLATRFSVSGYPTILYFPAGSLKPEKYAMARDAEGFVTFLNTQITDLNMQLPRAVKFVKEIGHDSFNAVALDPTKSAFVMFYAPWCGHCKKLHPVFERLATAYRNDNDVVIAAVNADEPHNKALATKYEVRGFPTLVFLAKDDKEKPEVYGGERELEALMTFFNKKAGKDRLTSGDLSFTVGVHAELTSLLKQLAADGKSETEKAELLAQIDAEVARIGEEGAKLYPRIAARVAKEGAAYVEKEMARIERVKAGAVQGAKRDLMSMRANILLSLKRD